MRFSQVSPNALTNMARQFHPNTIVDFLLEAVLQYLAAYGM